MSPNKFEEKPSQLENVYSINNENEPVKTGIAIDIWTETEVNSIETKYPSVSSNVSTIWIPIDNNQAEFLPSRPINIDETFFEIDSNYILDMNEYFYDPDQDETIGWKLNLPRKIRDLIFVENESGKVLFTEKVKSFEDLPLGIHKIICERKDSSHSFGQKSGMSRGVIRLAFRSNKSENIIKGIDLLREADTSSLEAIVKNQKESLSEAESNVLEILDKLKLKNENEKLSFIEKISIGKVALLETTEDQKVIKLDSTNSSGALFLESSTSNTSEEMDLKINNIYKSPNINMPLGEIDFSLDTNSAESSIVFIDVLDLETNINSIVKTNVFDEPSLFQSTQLTYEESVDGSLQEWLDSLDFNLNYYALPNSGMNIELESLKINMNDNLSEKLSSIVFPRSSALY